MANESPPEQDPELKILEGLRAEARDAYASFKKRLVAKAFQTPMDIAVEMDNLFSIMVDVSEKTLALHADLLDWRSGVDEELDAIAGEGGSSLIPSDAQNLKTFLLALQQNLRAAAGPDDDVPQVLSDKVMDTLKFIDEITVDPGEDEDEEQDDEDEDQN